MTIAARTLIEDVARYLSDYDEDESYVHWTQEDLLSYFKRAIGIVSIVKRDKFTRITEIKLVEGILQEVPSTCESDVKVLGLADENGTLKSIARKATHTKYPALGRPICKGRVKGNKDYKLNSYEYSDENPRYILVDPPVPANTDATLVITCYTPPDVTSLDSEVDLGADIESAIFELMLYYAWGVDIEDNANRERSDSHWNKAIQLLQLSNGAEALARQVR
nr:MAG TPA: head to tail adaptor [Caudoviricetes sp.]